VDAERRPHSHVLPLVLVSARPLVSSRGPQASSHDSNIFFQEGKSEGCMISGGFSLEDIPHHFCHFLPKQVARPVQIQGEGK